MPQEYTVNPRYWYHLETLLGEINAFYVSVPVPVRSSFCLKQEMSSDFFLSLNCLEVFPFGCVVVLCLFGALEVRGGKFN